MSDTTTSPVQSAEPSLQGLIEKNNPASDAPAHNEAAPFADAPAQPVSKYASTEPTLNDLLERNNPPPPSNEPFDESQIIQDGMTADFSDDVYAKYAEHFSKQFGKQIDPSDPFSHKMLHELISRGQKIAQQAPPNADDAADGYDGEPAAQQDADSLQEAAQQADESQSPLNAQAQFKQYSDGLDAVVQAHTQPEAASAWGTEMVTALFGEEMAAQVPDEAKVGFVQTQMKGALMMLDTILPRIMPVLVNQIVSEQFPMLGEIHNSRITEKALADVSREQGFGDVLQPHVFRAIQNVLAENPGIAQTEFKDNKGKPLSPLANRKHAIQIAYKIACGQAVSPAVLQQIAQKGKDVAARSADIAAASRLAAGESRGAFDAPQESLLSKMQRFQDESTEGRAGKETARKDDSYEWKNRGRGR